MDRGHHSPYDPYNSYNSFYGSYDSSHGQPYSSSFYRDNGYPMQYREVPPCPPRPQSLDMFALPCSFCRCRFHSASDCFHLNGALPISNPQLLGHHQVGNHSSNTNFGWNCQQSFQRDEGYNYGAPNYQWESPSHFETPNLPSMTNSFQPSPMPNVDDISQVCENGMVEMNSQVVESNRCLSV